MLGQMKPAPAGNELPFAVHIHQTVAAPDELRPVQFWADAMGIPLKYLRRLCSLGELPSCGDKNVLVRRSDLLALVDRAPRKRRAPVAADETESAHDALMRSES